ncbi:MAG: hypothetical protein DWQ45_03325 [Planctomycetota bacterium]|nr:MAG: hypothetical protein DWQ29_01060 [Planctomycetota bacterium]REK23472.1 MAG: hypothetical protein DWQ41_17130 [Planctomycetota bacterium]REK38888.1 MAG: hypothetical protein DWQ45_03325 [Planctomycetota bacterium]
MAQHSFASKRRPCLSALLDGAEQSPPRRFDMISLDRMPRVCFAMALILSCGSVAFAQDEGDVVTPTAKVDLKVENEVVATAAKGDRLTVRMVQGKWLWVENAEGERGWIEKRRVSLVDDDSPPDRPSPPDDEAAPDDGPDDDPWLVTIGVLAGQNIYTTYAYIGAVADGYANDNYDGEQTRELMQETISLAEVAIEHLKTVQKSNIVESDKEAIDDIVEIFELLKREATALSDFTQSGAQEDLDAYEEARTTVWPRIKSVLQIE